MLTFLCLTLLPLAPAQAAETLDLSVSIEFFDATTNVNPYSVWTVWAENHGSRDAHRVEVLLDRVNPLTKNVYYKFIDSSTDLHDPDAVEFKDIDYVKLDSGSGVWRVGALPAGSRKGARIFVRWDWTGSNAPPVTGEPGANTGRIPVPLTAEISNPRYQDPLPENNKVTAWGIIRKTAPTNFTRAAFATLLEAKADNLRPANNDGQAVNFTLKLDNPGTNIEGYSGPVWSLLSDVKLDITLSGLEVKTAPTAIELNGTTIKCKDSGTANDTLGTCAADDDYAEWDIGFLYSKSPLFDASSKPILKDCFGATTTNNFYICRELTLGKLALDGDMPLSQRCLEARIRSNPPPEGWQGGPLKVCLGTDDPPRLLLEDGQLDIFTLYPCVGTDLTSYPCNSDDEDSLEVAAGAYLPLDFTRRSDLLGDPTNSMGPRNTNSGKAALQTGYTTTKNPETQVFIQVKDSRRALFRQAARQPQRRHCRLVAHAQESSLHLGYYQFTLRY